jgi:hypothetical protein
MWMRTIVVGLLACLAAGCQTFYPNPGRFQAWTAASHAGLYHMKFHRWPADLGELAMLDCPRFDEVMNPDAFAADDARAMPSIRADVCAFLVEFPYRIDMQPYGRELRMSFRRANGNEICKLRVTAPAEDAAAAIAPTVQMHMTVFSCPGEGEFK